MCENVLATLSTEDRESHIIDMWGIDESDECFSQLSQQLQSVILSCEEFPTDVDEKKYDELILLSLSGEYIGVTNEYLEEQLLLFTSTKYKVLGYVEELNTCPCCGFKTLAELGHYEICGLCEWEDSGAVDLDDYSTPNRQTLRGAKEKFLMSKKSLPLNKWAK